MRVDAGEGKNIDIEQKVKAKIKKQPHFLAYVSMASLFAFEGRACAWGA